MKRDNGMQQAVADFEILYQQQLVPVRRIVVKNRPVFLVMPPRGAHLVVARAKGVEGDFWTCLPEDEHKHAMAQEIGPLIDQFINDHNKQHVLL